MLGGCSTAWADDWVVQLCMSCFPLLQGDSSQICSCGATQPLLAGL